MKVDATALRKIDRLWIAEAKGRRDAVRAGQAKTVPAEIALRQVRDALKR